MPLADLFEEEGVLKFALNNLDRAAFQSDHWTFLHIPKTAGSSFREEIANALQPDYNIEVDYQGLDAHCAGHDFKKQINLALNRYVKEGYFERTRFASGHLTYREIAVHQQFQQSKIISMLRDPVARLRSDYIFRTSSKHPLWESERERFPNFKAYIEHPENHDVMYRHLCRDPNEPVQDAIDFILKRYTFVGLQEMYPFSLKSVFMLLGQRIEPRLRLRDNQEEAILVPLPTEVERQFIQESNKQDFWLYEFLASRYKRLQSSFFYNTDCGRIFKNYAICPFRN